MKTLKTAYCVCAFTLALQAIQGHLSSTFVSVPGIILFLFSCALFIKHVYFGWITHFFCQGFRCILLQNELPLNELFLAKAQNLVIDSSENE